MRDPANLFAAESVPGGVGGAPKSSSSAGNIDRAASSTKNHFRTRQNPELPCKQEVEAEVVGPMLDALPDAPPVSEDASIEVETFDSAETQTPPMTHRQFRRALEPFRRGDNPPPGEWLARYPVGEVRPGGKQPYPNKYWKPWWKPRRAPVGTARRLSANLEAVDQVEEALGMAPKGLEALPRDEDGHVVPSPELADVLVAWTEEGGTLTRLARAVGWRRGELLKFMNRTEGLKDRYQKARSRGMDAVAEQALLIASEPVMVEESCESYDGNGNLMRRDVRVADATFARKLAFQARIDLLKRWAPDRYGDKVEVKTTDAMAMKILAARRRLMGGEGEEAG